MTLHHSKLIKGLLMACAVVGLASAAMLANAQNSGSCRGATDRDACMQSQMAQHMQEHEAKLHDALKLTAAQEPAWKTFTDTAHQQIAAMQAEHKSMPSRADMDKLSAPERVQNHLTMMQKHIAMMQTHLDSLKQFYAVLTPDQQATMNTAMAKMHRHWSDMHRDHADHGNHGNHIGGGSAAAPASPAPAQN